MTRAPSFRPLVLAVLLALSAFALFGAGIATAQGLPPRCGPEHRGVEACMSGDTCTCDWYPGGSISAEPAGWRWQCDIERMCGDPPAGADASGLPPGTTILPQVDWPQGGSSPGSFAGRVPPGR